MRPERAGPGRDPGACFYLIKKAAVAPRAFGSVLTFLKLVFRLILRLLIFIDTIQASKYSLILYFSVIIIFMADTENGRIYLTRCTVPYGQHGTLMGMNYVLRTAGGNA